MKNSFIDLFEKCSDELKDLAFTHSSFAHEKKIESNERIEFLGDTILGCIVGDYLYKHTKLDEGKMTKIRSKFVCTENLAMLAKKIKIENRIRLGKSFKDKISDAVLADTIESMIGAIYLTYGLHSIQTAVLEALNVKELLKQGMRAQDYKSELQEFCQESKMKLEYKCETYLTKAGTENFRASTFVNKEFVAYGQGSTKKEAEQNSAKLALKKLKNN